MADDNYRVDRLEKDVTKLQEKSENNSVIINKMDKDNGKAEIYQAQIMANLASITSSVAKTLDKATQTEILAFNLKTVTDKQTVDINNIGADLKDTKKKVTHIESLPAENATKTKWIAITVIGSNIIGLFIWLFNR